MPSHAELLTALYRRGHRGVELGLDRVLVGAQAVGAPHQRLRALHVAGTNGKGSTCAMLEAVALRAGLRVGLYTSPHLCRLAERVRIGGEPIAEAALDEALARVLSDAPAELTFFETLTLAAFVAFEEAALDVVVLEVGLGGRLDATNLVERPLATGITNITIGDGGRDLEHAALLGSTSEAIAREKAGIGKRGCPLVVGAMDAAAREVILAVAEERGASPIYVCRGGEDRAALMPDGSSLALAPRLIGPHQRDNAHVAAAMASFAAPELGLGPSDIEAGVAEAVWPARFELLSIDGREVILDCAHNVEGARSLAATLAARGHRPERSLLVFGALADKGFASMLRLLAPLARERIYTCPAGRAPADPSALTEIAPGAAEPSPAAAIELALRRAAPDDTVIVCGSIYLVGAVRAHLLGLPTDPVIAL